MKILFICRHNVFRSKVAESYFKKINKNKNIHVTSSGLIIGRGLTAHQKKIVKLQKDTAKDFGIDTIYNPEPSTVGLLKKQDLIIITADDIPKSFFHNRSYSKKVIIWKIPDYKEKNPKESIKKSIELIIKKINSLVEELKDKS